MRAVGAPVADHLCLEPRAVWVAQHELLRRKRELRGALMNETPVVFHVLQIAIQSLIAEVGGSMGGAAMAPLEGERKASLDAALKGLTTLLSWAPLDDHLSPQLFQTLFSLVECAANATPGGTSAALDDCGAAALGAVTEVVKKRLVPPKYQNFVLDLVKHKRNVDVCNISKLS